MGQHEAVQGCGRVGELRARLGEVALRGVHHGRPRRAALGKVPPRGGDAVLAPALVHGRLGEALEGAGRLGEADVGGHADQHLRNGGGAKDDFVGQAEHDRVEGAPVVLQLAHGGQRPQPHDDDEAAGEDAEDQLHVCPGGLESPLRRRVCDVDQGADQVVAHVGLAGVALQRRDDAAERARSDQHGKPARVGCVVLVEDGASLHAVVQHGRRERVQAPQAVLVVQAAALLPDVAVDGQHRAAVVDHNLKEQR
mmetsp:Transcript_17357/g.65705  ORF Transcript_17357/g.65705 Transcript_17357/m.65705 type:complete len:253 (-) Transcript_17357:3889-4647(-)